MDVLPKKAAGAAKEAEQAVRQLCKERNGNRRLAATFDEAENALNHCLRNLHNLVGSTAAPTSALSCGTGDSGRGLDDTWPRDTKR